MVVYEVNLDVDQSVAHEFRAWLGRHVAEMLELPDFEDAEILRVSEPPEGRCCWSCRYFLKNHEALDQYFRDSAERMRADGLKRFGGKFSAFRRILVPELTN